MPNARLYEVQSTRGTIYTLHDLSNDTIWTERSELSVRSVARERGLTIVEEEVVSHEELMRRIGREAPAAKPCTSAQPTTPAQEDVGAQFIDVNPVSSAPPPLQVQYHWDDSPLLKADDAIVIPRGALKSVRNVFCSETPVTESVRSAGGEDPAKKA